MKKIIKKISKINVLELNKLHESKLNKKGFSMISESDKILFWFFIFFVISLCIVFIVAWTSNLRSMYLNDALQPTTYEARLIYSDKCFAYKDSNGRVYTGTIDLNKFNAETFYNCVPLSNADEHAMAVTLNAEEGAIITLKSSNWNINTQQIIQTNYVVQVKSSVGISPGLLTFSHKSGE
jgi:hypothetical protein